MPKTKKNTDTTRSGNSADSNSTMESDLVNHFDQPEVWDVLDDSDEAFWKEFFHLQDVLATTDELDPAIFSLTVENHQTGEIKTFSNIQLKPARSALLC